MKRPITRMGKPSSHLAPKPAWAASRRENEARATGWRAPTSMP